MVWFDLNIQQVQKLNVVPLNVLRLLMEAVERTDGVDVFLDVLVDRLCLLRSFSEIPQGLMIIQTRSQAQEQSLGFHGNILKYAFVHLCVLIRAGVELEACFSHIFKSYCEVHVDDCSNSLSAPLVLVPVCSRSWLQYSRRSGEPAHPGRQQHLCHQDH